MTGGSPAGREMVAFVAFGDICASVVTKTSYDRYLLAEWIHRVGENTSDIRVGTM